MGMNISAIQSEVSAIGTDAWTSGTLGTLGTLGLALEDAGPTKTRGKMVKSERTPMETIGKGGFNGIYNWFMMTKLDGYVVEFHYFFFR